MRRWVSVVLLLVLVAAFALSATAAMAVEKWKVQGYTLAPQEKWTPGCIKGWKEGQFVPHRLVVKDFVLGRTYSFSFWDDYRWKGKGNPYGFDYSSSFGVIGGTLNSVVDNGFVNAQNAAKHTYTITFTPDGSTAEVIVSWFGHLAVTTPGAKGASYWPGATLDTRIQWRDPVIPGERTLPHQA